MAGDSVTQRFEYKDDKSSKFWEIQVSDNSFTVRYGKIGTDGQTQTKNFADAATAEIQAQKLIGEKTGKGYLAVSADLKEKEANDKITNDPNALTCQNPSNAPDLVAAIWSGESEPVVKALEAGLDPNERTGFGKSYGKTPLHVAAETAYFGMAAHAFLKVMPILFEATEQTGWKLGRLLGDGRQEMAALSIITMLLDKGADPLALNGDGLTPMEALLKYDCDVSTSHLDGLFSRLFEILVPAYGNAPSVQGELFRAIGKLRHERFQNGWCNLIDGGYESYLDDLYHFFVDTEMAAATFSVQEQKLSRLAVSMAIIEAYDESGQEPTSSIGQKVYASKKVIRSGWKRALAESGGDIEVSSEPLEAVSDFCIEFCRRHPVLIAVDQESPMSLSVADVFAAASAQTPLERIPDLMNALSSSASSSWLALHAEFTGDPFVIDSILKMEDGYQLKDALRHNTHLTTKQIDLLASEVIDETLAANPAIPASKLNNWAKDEDPSIRIGVARNKSTPLATLSKLAKDTEQDVQAAAKQETARREQQLDSGANKDEPKFGEDLESHIRWHLIIDDLDGFTRLANQLDPKASATLLTLVCTMPLSAVRRLSFVRPLLATCKAAKGIPVGMLVDLFITDLGKKNADNDVAATREILLELLNPQCSLESVSAEAQCQLYEYHREGRQAASEILYALIERGMPIKELSNYRPDKDGNSLSEKTAYHGDIELMSHLLKSTTIDGEGETNPLSIAIRRKNHEMIDLLLGMGSDRSATISSINKAISDVCYPDMGKPVGIESLSKLITAYRQLEGTDAVTALLFEHLCGAVENGYLELVEELIRNGAPVDHRDGNVTWGNLLGSFFEMNPKDKVFMALVDAGLDLTHPIADRYKDEIQKILKRAKR